MTLAILFITNWGSNESTPYYDMTALLPASHMFIREWNEPSSIYSVSIHQMAPPE